ncbi:MAG: peptidoglycan editing factor PgeF [Methanococcaceae archaeon]
MAIIKSFIFQKYPEIIFGFSTKKNENDTPPPYFFNLSLSVGDDENKVKKNRTSFFGALGIDENNIVLQKQVHSDICTRVDKGGMCGESDALITNKPDIALVVSVADCTPIFLYDTKEKVIAAIHSGWKGTEKRIVSRTLQKMKEDFQTKAANIIAYIGPSISQQNYEIGSEVAALFDEKYLKEKGEKFLLDVKGANYDMLIDAGVLRSNIQMSALCTFELQDLLHSYRRDGTLSGRLMGLIALKGGK